MRANSVRKFPPFVYNGGILPDTLFPYLGEATYERADNLCPHCLVASQTVGHLWVESDKIAAGGDLETWVWGRLYVFCPNCHWVFNVRTEARLRNWRSKPTAEEARKRLGREAK